MGLLSLLKKKNRTLLFTTPSHDRALCILHKFYQWYRADISEVDAYNPETALALAEERAAKIYNTYRTKFLTNGSTSGVIAAVLACCKPNDKLLVWEKSHPCHKNAGKLVGAEIIEYSLPYNEKWGIYEKLENIEELIEKHAPKAIIVTSPSYEGIVSNIPYISEVCKKHNVYLIVDEAHGALYPFSDNLPESAIKYADFTVQSLHKTAGGINPTALLHSNCNLDIDFAFKLINTTSPSYPMLMTIEANINYLNSKNGKQKIEALISEIKNLKREIQGIEFYGDDITKILIAKENLTGYELSEILFKKFNIEDERTNEKSTMLLTGLGTTSAKLLCLKRALLKISSKY